MSHHQGHPVLALVQLTASIAARHVSQRSADRNTLCEMELERSKVDALREATGFAHEFAMAKVRVVENLMQGQLDLAFKSFEFMKGVIEREHASLIQERNEINRAKIMVTDPRISVNMGTRIGQITTEMNELRKNGMLLVAQINFIAQSIGKGEPIAPLMIG